MTSVKTITTIAGYLFLITLVWPKGAMAYLDPGSGTYLIQMIIAGMVGFGFFFRKYWQQVKSFFTKKKDGKDKR